jgi:hypothetical protein
MAESGNGAAPAWDRERGRIAPSAGGYEPPPAGTHPARVVAVCALGVQADRFAQGKERPDPPREKLWVVFELCCKARRSDGQPFVVGKESAASAGPKSNLGKIARGVLGKAFDENDFAPCDVLGQAVLVGVEHEVKDGQARPKTRDVLPLPEGMTCPGHARPLAWWQWGDPLADIPAWLPYYFGKPVAEVVRQAVNFARTYGATAHAGKACDED